MATDLVVQEVEAVAEAGPERGRVKQLEGLGGGHPGSQFQLVPKQGPPPTPTAFTRRRKCSPPGTPP